MRIVFVCTTNVWGSAMADLMARSLLAEWDPDRRFIQVESAGVRAHVGAPIPIAAQQVLAELGLNAGKHRARWMSADVLAGADLVLTVGAIQRDAALALNPRGLRKTFTLLEAASLVDCLTASFPLAVEADLHARRVVSEMAAARRFRSVPAGSDDLIDLIGDDVDGLRALAGRVSVSLEGVLRTLLVPAGSCASSNDLVEATSIAVA